MLSKFGEADKEPPMMAQMMSTLKTNVKLMADDSDATVADLVTDGCNMGIKTLSKRVNECALADRHAHDTARKLIDLETDLLKQVRCYL